MRARRLAFATVVATAVVSGVAWGAVNSSNANEERLAGAELIAGGGNETARADGTSLDSLRFGSEDRPLDVRADLDGGVWLLTTAFLSHFDEDGEVDWAAPGYRSVPSAQVQVSPTGDVYYLSRIDSRMLGNVVSGPSDDRSPVHPPVPVASASFASDGTLLVSSMTEARIMAVHPDESVSAVLVPAGDAPGPALRFDDHARLTVVGLDDGRIVFATNAIDGGDGDGDVYVIDRGELTRLDTTASHGIRRIFPGPDGTVLALDGPNISLLDPDSGQVETLIDLFELGPELEPPASADDVWPQGRTSATTVGDDLVFIAENRVWRLDDAFG